MASLVSSILSSSESTHESVVSNRPAAPSRLQPHGDDVFFTLAQNLRDLHLQLAHEPPDIRSRVEIEARIGLISLPDRLARATPSIPGSGAVKIEAETMRGQGLRFVSGVSPPMFASVNDSIARSYKKGQRQSTEVVYLFDSGPLQGQRVVVDGAKPPYREHKQSRPPMNFQLPAADYDLRVHASIENLPVLLLGPDGKPMAVPGNWSGKRTKRRVSWESPPDTPQNEAWLWRADLTLVEEVAKDSTGNRRTQVVREVELELLPHVRDLWLGLKDEKEVIAMTSKIATHLFHLLEAINPIEELSAIANPVPEPDQAARAAANAACLQLRGNRSGKGSNFPGAQPVNMCKRTVADVQRNSYYVAEKTDGVRYLMISVLGSAGATCVLVDRSENVFKVDGGAFLAEVLGTGTVLDGELVHNRSMKKAIFMAFDILQYKERILMPQNFIERLRDLRTGVMQTYAQHIHGEGASLEPHLMLVMKSFKPRRKIMDLFRHVSTEGRERVFMEDKTRHHKTDGVIFQPNAPYTMGTDTKLLKWKWIDLASVDLKVYPGWGGGGGGGMGGGSDLRLCSVANHNEEVDLSSIVHLADHDKARLTADMDGKRTVIAEVALDPASGLWVYMGLRPDKNRPNFINTVIATMVEVAEGLSEEELKYRMLADAPATDDWATQEATMRKRAVQWQYKQAEGGSAGGAGGGGRGENGAAAPDRRRSETNGKRERSPLPGGHAVSRGGML